MQKCSLIRMMLKNEPIETFEKLFGEDHENPEWGYLLNMCYCEERYESVGGDFGYMKNPPIDYERLAYLKKLISFLEANGVTEKMA